MASAEGGGELDPGLLDAVAESADGDAGLPTDRGHSVSRLVGLSEQSARLVVQGLAGGRQAHAGRRSLEQQDAEVGLQLFDGPAQRRLGHVQPCRSTTEVEFLGHGDEVAQQA
jgi:hypothetical protein